MHVLFPRLEPDLEALLRPGLDSRLDLRRDGERADVLIEGRPEPSQLDTYRPQILLIPYAGLPAETRKLLAGRPETAVHNLHHNAVPTAELALSLLFAVAKRIVPYDRDLRRGDWSRRYDDDGGQLLAGRRALVIGFGAVGRELANRLAALGLSVSVVRRRKPPSASESEFDWQSRDSWRGILPEVDFVFLTVPLTEETRGLLGREEFEALPDHAIVINVARGPVIQEEALYTALKERRIGGAGLDVWYEYPKDEAARTQTPPSRLDFSSFDHVVLSPHRAGHSDATPNLRAKALRDSLNAWAASGEMPNRVDLDRGY